MTSTIEKVVEEIKSLTPRERHHVREILNALPDENAKDLKEKALERLLINKGIINHIPSPISDTTAYQNRKLVTIQGKPLSESILEERR